MLTQVFNLAHQHSNARIQARRLVASKHVCTADKLLDQVRL